MNTMEKLKQAVIDVDFEPEEADAIVHTLLDEQHAPMDIVNQALIPAIEVVGQLYIDGEYFIPEMLYSIEKMNTAMDLLIPFFLDNENRKYGKIVLGTVEGDTHDIGKNILASMLSASGFDVINLGADVAPERFVEAVKEHDCKLLGMSALLTSTMGFMGTTIDLLKEAGIRDQVKVMVGGAVITQKFADDIGADGYADDAVKGVALAKELYQAMEGGN